MFPHAKFLRMARDIAATHHERFNGAGYPAGLRGEEIPLCGRIMAVADVYDALTLRRVYKEAFDHDVAVSIIVQESGRTSIQRWSSPFSSAPSVSARCSTR